MEFNVFFALGVLIGILGISFGVKWNGDCSVPPEGNDVCCKEDFYEDDPVIAQNCAKKYDIPLDAKNNIKIDDTTRELSFEDLSCFTDCLLTAEKVLVNGEFNMDKIKSDIMKMSKNETELADILIAAYETCSKTVPKNIENLKNKLPKGKCPVLAEVVTECIEMELYANCPEGSFNPSPDCADAKAYAIKCKEALFK